MFPGCLRVVGDNGVVKGTIDAIVEEIGPGRQINRQGRKLNASQ